MSTLAQYKETTLARPDVLDIVKIEAVERVPTRAIINGRQETTGYDEVEHTLESGRKMKKYDVHLVKLVKVNGLETKQFVTEAIAIFDEGTPNEEVVIVTPIKAERAATAVERYIRKLPYLDVDEVEIDPERRSARIQALKDNGDGTAKEVEVFIYTVPVKGAPDTIKHVEIIK